LEPLIFVEDRLVGWRWSYLADVLGQRVSMKARRWDFGAFCDGRRTSPPDTESSDAEPSEPTSTPRAEPSGSDVDR
jgi:hypothetical protein